VTADELNVAIAQIATLPRVRFEVGLGESADNWLRKKHAQPGDVHEPATLAAFLAAFKRGGIKQIFDVGALYGYFTLFALSLFDEAEVTAFEMHPGTVGPLYYNVAPYAGVVAAAISDQCRRKQKIWISGFNIFEEPTGGWEMLETIPGAMKERGPGNRGRGFAEVDFITLDAWCADHPAPDLIKIDVEGFQAKAVRGGLNTIAAHKPMIVIELHDPEKLARFGTTNAQTVKPLFDLGYKAFWCPNFRDKNARFEPVEAMDERHEKLCIMVFAV
jgi:FkbM family methyltransferase